MFKAMLVMLGGGIGSLGRYWLSLAVFMVVGRSFPIATLIVNVVGSFVMGFLAVLLIEKIPTQSVHLQLFLLVGILGGFTTFSAFSLETFYLFDQAEILKGLLNMIGSVVFCLLAVSAGVLIARHQYA